MSSVGLFGENLAILYTGPMMIRDLDINCDSLNKATYCLILENLKV